MEKLTKVGVWGVQGMAEEKYNYQNDQNWAKIWCNYLWTNPDDPKAKFFLWKLGIFSIKFLDDFNTLKTQVKQLYNIPIQESCVLHRKTKSCPLIRKEPLPSLDSSSRTSISNLTPSTRSPEIKSIKNENEEPEPPEEASLKRSPPSMAKLAVMVQNFLEPLCPVQSSMVGKQYQDKVRLTQSLSVPAVKREAPQQHVETLNYRSKDNEGVFKQKSFYLTTW